MTRPTSSRSGATAVDANIVARCRQGDPMAWPELVRLFAPYVHTIAALDFRLSEHDAEDVFQEVFLRMWQHLDELRCDAAVRPWIGQLTRRLAVDRLRSIARHRARAGLDLEPTTDLPADDAMVHLDERLRVRAALSRLPRRDRDLVERFFVQGHSQAHIAATLGVAEGTVAARVHRVRRRLRWELAR